MKPSWYISPVVALVVVITSIGGSVAALFLRPSLNAVHPFLGTFSTFFGWFCIGFAIAMTIYAFYSAVRWQRVSYVRDDLA